jgi:Mce-associated membrane protein
VPALLAAVIVLLGGFGVWATLKANSLSGSDGPQNTALTDAATTSAVRHQVGAAVNQIFSYRYTDTAATRRAAQSLLTGRAIRQYDQLFSLVEKEAPVEKLVVTTTVTNSGVESLQGNTARVLIFANQQDTRSGTSQSSYAGAMFAVTAVRAGNRWKIENIDTFAGG